VDYDVELAAAAEPDHGKAIALFITVHPLKNLAKSRIY
jgi:hypothetical protein